MYRSINEILKETGAAAYILSDGNKTFKFTNSSFPVQGDYIFLPMTRFEEETFPEIEEHLKNPNCKGFFIPRALIEKDEYLKILHKYFPENVFVVNNIYNTGFKIAKFIAAGFNPEVIIVAGTDEADEIKETLSRSLEIENLPYDTYWQKAIDPILRAEESQKFVILQTDIQKNKTAKLLADIKKGSVVVYSKISLTNMKLYQTIDKYNDEWLNLISNMPKNVYVKENNDLLTLPKLSNLIITDDLTGAVLEAFNKEKMPPLNMGAYKSGHKRVSVNRSGSLYSVKKSIRRFISDNKDFQKAVIISKIPNLDKFSDSIHTEIIKELNDEIDLVVFVNMSKFLPALRGANKKAKILSVSEADEDGLIEIKQFLKFETKGTKASYLIISGDKNLWNLI